MTSGRWIRTQMGKTISSSRVVAAMQIMMITMMMKTRNNVGFAKKKQVRHEGIYNSINVGYPKRGVFPHWELGS